MGECQLFAKTHWGTRVQDQHMAIILFACINTYSHYMLLPNDSIKLRRSTEDGTIYCSESEADILLLLSLRVIPDSSDIRDILHTCTSLNKSHKIKKINIASCDVTQQESCHTSWQMLDHSPRKDGWMKRWKEERGWRKRNSIFPYLLIAVSKP